MIRQQPETRFPPAAVFAGVEQGDVKRREPSSLPPQRFCKSISVMKVFEEISNRRAIRKCGRILFEMLERMHQGQSRAGELGELIVEISSSC
jgi:hypothetical protein